MRYVTAVAKLTVLTATLLATSARADESGTALVVARAQAMKMGAERGAAVREARAPAAASAPLREAAGAFLPYAPKIMLFGGRREGAFGAGPELGGSVTQDLSLHGLGGARRESAEAVDTATRPNVDRARLESAAHALVAWADLLETQELLQLRTAARIDAEEIARVAQARVTRGVAMPIEASLAEAEVGAALLAERDAEGALVGARATLAFALGLPPAGPPPGSPTLIAVGALGGDDALAPSPPRREHPAEAAARSQVALAQADAKLARAQASPPLSVGFNAAREGTGEKFLTGVVTFPLPLLDPTRFDAARQQANVLTAEARARRVRDELARDGALAAHERTHTREVCDTLRTRVLEPLRETVRLARAGYQAGTQDATSLLLLRQRLVSAEEQLRHARGEVTRADIRHALARGTLLEEGT